MRLPVPRAVRLGGGPNGAVPGCSSGCSGTIPNERHAIELRRLQSMTAAGLQPTGRQLFRGRGRVNGREWPPTPEAA